MHHLTFRIGTRYIYPISEAREFLRKNEYRTGVEQLVPMAEAIQEAIAAERERAAEMEAEKRTVEHSD